MTVPLRFATVAVILLSPGCGVTTFVYQPATRVPVEATYLPPPVQVAESGQPMSGPTLKPIGTNRLGAAIVLAHREFVLVRPPVARQPAMPPDAALRAVTDARQGSAATSLPSQGELGQLAAALYRYCHHWPRPTDVGDLVTYGLIAAGASASDACAYE